MQDQHLAEMNAAEAIDVEFDTISPDEACSPVEQKPISIAELG
jgi:hypothetical protein